MIHTTVSRPYWAGAENDATLSTDRSAPLLLRHTLRPEFAWVGTKDWRFGFLSQLMSALTPD
jgi:hypothetical protein